jgi:hypothetical protein
VHNPADSVRIFCAATHPHCIHATTVTTASFFLARLLARMQTLKSPFSDKRRLQAGNPRINDDKKQRAR